MIHFSTYLFFRFIRAFQAWNGFQADDVPSGETQKMEIVKHHPYDAIDGVARGIIKFNNLEYLLEIRPIFSQIKVEKPLMYSDIIKGENHDK